MAIDSLLEGYAEFKQGRYLAQRELYEKLESEGQSPKALFIACCDSRCDPSIITEASPGELFVIRNVANLVPPYAPDDQHHGTSAAIEFAVRHLKVEHIIVMGHAQCGGVKHLWENGGQQDAADDFLTPWVNIGEDARQEVIAKRKNEPDLDPQLALEYEVVKLSLRNLLTFGWLKERVDAGELQLHGWYFGIASGQLRHLNPVTGDFSPLEI